MSKFPVRATLGLKRKPRLSLNFANKLIESEQLLEKECNLANINLLIALYSEAIEFYEYQNDSKAKTFQEKLQSLFLKPEVISAMNLTQLRSPKVEESKSEPNRYKSKSPLPTPSTQDKETQESKSMTRMIASQSKRNSEVFKKAQLEFKSQDNDLSKRLASRKKSMLSKSTSLIKENSVVMQRAQNTGNILEDINESELPDVFFDELEELMAQLCEGKTRKLAQVKLQYEVQMAPLANQGVLMEQVLERMRDDMNEAVAVVGEEFAERYQEELAKLRNKYKALSYVLMLGSFGQDWRLGDPSWASLYILQDGNLHLGTYFPVPWRLNHRNERQELCGHRDGSPSWGSVQAGQHKFPESLSDD